MILSIIIVLLILVPPLVVAYRSISNNRKWIVFSALLILPLFFYGLIIFYPDHRFLYPVVLKAYESGISPNPMAFLIWGLPVILIIAIVTLALLFFGKYIKYLLPDRVEINNP
jgi:hypothetical protein